MELGSLFLILALLVLVVLFISRPLITPKGLPPNEVTDRGEYELLSLLEERERILIALQELDFDYALGKIPEETYPPQRSALMSRGAEVLRRLDSIQSPSEGKNLTNTALTWKNESTIEQPLTPNGRKLVQAPDGAIQNRENAHAANLAVVFPDDDLEVILAKRRRERQEKSNGFCSMCGDPVRKSDRYCPKCGAKSR